MILYVVVRRNEKSAGRIAVFPALLRYVCLFGVFQSFKIHVFPFVFGNDFPLLC